MQNVQGLLNGVRIPDIIKPIESPTEFKRQFFGTAHEDEIYMAHSDEERDTQHKKQHKNRQQHHSQMFQECHRKCCFSFKCNKTWPQKHRRRQIYGMSGKGAMIESVKKLQRDNKNSRDATTKNVKQLMQGRYVTTTRHNFEQTKRR